MRNISGILQGTALCLLLLLCVPCFAQTVATPAGDEEALAAATHSLCDARIAMLGEIGSHGDGHTLAFKVALVERLVERCGFDAVLFEANQDEFLHLDQRLRAGEAVAPDDLLTAVGGLWKFYKEFSPLAPFLIQRARTGKLLLGGIDDQLAQLGQSYANDDMIASFTSLLNASDRQNCAAAFHRRIYYEFPEDKPYSKADQAQLINCLARVNDAVRADRILTGTAKEDRQEMIVSTMRWLMRDFTPDSESVTNRGRSMVQTFEWMESRFSLKNRKIIIWAGTAHISKEGDPAWGDGTGANFGSFVHRKYGDKACSLGFSAIGGSFRYGRGNFPAIPIAPANSVEAEAFQGSAASAAFVNSKQLAAMGTRPGAFFYHTYQALPWSEFLDDVVVFRTERPPSDMR